MAFAFICATRRFKKTDLVIIVLSQQGFQLWAGLDQLSTFALHRPADVLRQALVGQDVDQPDVPAFLPLDDELPTRLHTGHDEVALLVGLDDLVFLHVLPRYSL